MTFHIVTYRDYFTAQREMALGRLTQADKLEIEIFLHSPEGKAERDKFIASKLAGGISPMPMPPKVLKNDQDDVFVPHNRNSSVAEKSLSEMRDRLKAS